MFKTNKYSRWYNNIISHAQTKVNRMTDNERYEKHHIIPKSLGGNDEVSNLVRLTPREHFICHLLLLKMVSGNHLYKMTAAINLMINNTNKRLGRVKVTNRKYDSSRFYSRTDFSEEHRKRLSEAAKARDPSSRKQSVEANAKRSLSLKNYTKTPEHIAKIAESQRGQTRDSWGEHSQESKDKISSMLKNKPKSEQAKINMSIAASNRKLGTRGPYKKKIPLSEIDKTNL